MRSRSAPGKQQSSSMHSRYKSSFRFAEGVIIFIIISIKLIHSQPQRVRGAGRLILSLFKDNRPLDQVVHAEQEDVHPYFDQAGMNPRKGHLQPVDSTC